MWLTVNSFAASRPHPHQTKPGVLQATERAHWLFFQSPAWPDDKAPRLHTFAEMINDGRVDNAILDVSQLKVESRTEIDGGLQFEVAVGTTGSTVSVELDTAGRVIYYAGQGSVTTIDPGGDHEGDPYEEHHYKTRVEMQVVYGSAPLVFERPEAQERALFTTMEALITNHVVFEKCSESMVEPGDLRSLDHCLYSTVNRDSSE